jgi:hypothetical protein
MSLAKILVLVGMSLVSAIVHADPGPTPVLSRGETTIAATPGNLMVQAKIKMHEVQIGKPSDARPTVIESNCTYSKYPCSIVDRIDLIVNGTTVFVPRSAFCDLADVTSAEIKADKKGWILRLYGGDGAESFIVKLEFDATHVKRRTRAGGESADQLSEETRYHVVVFD